MAIAPMAAIRFVSQNVTATRNVTTSSAVWRNAKPIADSTSIWRRRSTSSRSSTAKSEPRTRTISFSVPPNVRRASSNPRAAGMWESTTLMTRSATGDQQSGHEADGRRKCRHDSDGAPRVVAHVLVGRIRRGLCLAHGLLADFLEAAGGGGECLLHTRLDCTRLVAAGGRDRLEE